MEKQPKISVVIPIYNAEKYLRQCLDSVVEQTLRDIEIICVDDGSSDRSVAIVQAYCEKDARVRLLQQENQGAGIARNKGIQAAEGRYIAFLDSDDYYPDNGALAALYQAADAHDALICGGSVAFLRRDRIVPAKLRDTCYYFEEEGWVDYRDFQQDFYYQRFLFSRSMLVDNDLLFPYYRRYQDPPFFVRAMLQAERFYAIPQVVYIYREGASSALWTAQKVYDRLEGMRDELEVTREAGLRQLHSQVARRVKNVLNSIRSETEIAEEEQTKAAFLNIYHAMDRSAVEEFGSPGELDYLEDYLEEQLRAERVLEQQVTVRRGSAYAGGTAPKVSVIIPVYNVEEYLRQCLDSVVDQTLREIEIICVNDETRDNSGRILEEYAEKDGRVTIIEEKNRGLSGARNSGFREARGEYVYFLDSDDYLSPDAMETLYAVCKEKDLDAVFFDFTQFYDDGTMFPTMERHGYSGVYDGVTFLKLLRDDRAYIQTAWSQMLRREFLAEKGIEFYEGIIHEDNLFTFYVLMEARRVSHVDQKLYHHRLRANSIMTVPRSSKNVIGYFISMQEMMRYGLRREWGRKKEAEIWRSFENVWKDTGYELKKISDGEKQQVRFDNPFSQLLFDTFFLQDGISAEQPERRPEREDRDRELRILRAKNRALEREIRNIHASATYKIGRFITWLPRKLRGGVRCYQEHGMTYTLHRLLVHLHLEKDPYQVTFRQPKPVPVQTRTAPAKVPDQAPAAGCEERLKFWYRNVTKKELDLDHPRTFNEKIQWIKLYDSTPLKTLLADKYLYRGWVEQEFGSQYLIPLLGVWNSFDEIDLKSLPEQFVLKANHGSGWNIIVRDKAKFDAADAAEKLTRWLGTDFALSGSLEMHYSNIPPRIIAEEYHPCQFEYQYWCFNGEPKFISAIHEPHGENSKATYDLDWKKLDFVTSLPRLKEKLERPAVLEDMNRIARSVCERFAFVRVDFLYDGTSLFLGEITFTPATGLCRWDPPAYDRILGDMLTLPPKSPIPERKF